jgi:hypothetical protein
MPQSDLDMMNAVPSRNYHPNQLVSQSLAKPVTPPKPVRPKTPEKVNQLPVEQKAVEPIPTPRKDLEVMEPNSIQSTPKETSVVKEDQPVQPQQPTVSKPIPAPIEVTMKQESKPMSQQQNVKRENPKQPVI